MKDAYALIGPPPVRTNISGFVLQQQELVPSDIVVIEGYIYHDSLFLKISPTEPRQLHNLLI